MEHEKKESIEIKKNSMVNNEITIESPVKGRIIKQEDIKDNDIASGILGQGFGVLPEKGIVKAPFDGVVLSLFPTMHAIGIGEEDGIQMLIHVGVNTANLEGKYFFALVEQGEKIKKNQPILKFDLESIKNEGYDITTAVLVTNHEKFENIRFIMS